MTKFLGADFSKKFRQHVSDKSLETSHDNLHVEFGVKQELPCGCGRTFLKDVKWQAMLELDAEQWMA